MRRAVCIPLLLIASLLVAAPVSAARPEVNVIVVEGSSDIPCDGFVAVQEFAVTIREKLWFDDEGALERLVANIHWEGTITNSMTGFTVRDNASWTEFFDTATEIFRQAGLIWNLNIPGEGIVALDAGLLIFEPDGSVTVHGPHEVFEQGEAVVCAAVS